MSDSVKMVDGDDENANLGQHPLRVGRHPLSGTEEKGQQVLPTSDNSGQDTILPEMQFPDELPADDD